MNEGDWVFFYIWIAGFILSLPIIIYWMNYKEFDGRTVIDMRKITIILCGAIIGNIGIVMLFLMAAGIWIFVKIGEWISPLGDITFYDSGPPNEKNKKMGRKNNSKSPLLFKQIILNNIIIRLNHKQAGYKRLLVYCMYNQTN